MKNVLIYTAVYGGYDKRVRAPLESSVGGGIADWVVYGDRRVKVSSPYVWQKRTYIQPSARLCARNVKILMPLQYDVTIWHGGNVQIGGNLEELIALSETTGIAVLRHSQRNCIYDEANVCIDWGKDTAERIKPQMRQYANEGYPHKNGLSCHFLMVRQNTAEIRQLNQMWWNEVVVGSYRDQLSFDYCCWRMGIKPAIIEGDIFRGPNFVRHPLH